MTKLLISIVTWNSSESIEACIESILKQAYPSCRIVILDNNSSDDTLLKIEKYSGEIDIISSKENTGFCGGHNYIINNFKSDFVLLVNPDIVLIQDYIIKAMNVIEKKHDVGTFCGLLLQSDGESPLIDSAGMAFDKSRRFLIREHGKKLDSVNLVQEYVDGADGALPLYRRKMIDEISIENEFFDSMFFAHKEDWDVSWRSTIYGWKIFFDPNCIAIHPRVFKQENLKSRKQLSPFIKYHAVKNQLIMVIKNDKFGELIRNVFYFLPRQILIFIYVLFFERESLKGYFYVLKNLGPILNKRHIIKMNSKKTGKIYS